MKRDGARLQTLDAYLSRYLLFTGHHPVLENQGGKVVFIFKSGPDLDKAIAKFYSGAQVPAAAFAASVKSLRGLIHEKRMEKGKQHEQDNPRLG